MTVLRFVPIVLVLLVLAGCSRVQFAYNQLDWVIPYYVEDYVKLTDTQGALLDDRVEALLAWHCRTQLGAYAGLLRSANADFQAGTMTRQRLQAYTVQLRDYWRAIMEQVSPAVAELLLTASDGQIEELFRSFEEKNETRRSEYEDDTDAERRERHRERMTEELKRWIGPLRPAQEQAVRAWSRGLIPLGPELMRSRREWQANLRAVIDRRADEAAFRTGIARLFVEPRVLRSPAIEKRFQENTALALGLIHEIAMSLDAEQRRHLSNQVASYARDLDELACSPETAGARTPNRAEIDRQGRDDVRADP